MATLYTQQGKNIRKTWALMAAFLVLVIALGYGMSWYFGSPVIMYGAIIFALIMNVGSYWFSDTIVLSMTGAEPATKSQYPELWNIVRGDMSLVGPRPLPARYLPRYSPEQAHRHDVVPGVTGWAQVNGRNAIAWEEKFRLDVWYVSHIGFWLDLKILFMTVGKVFRRDGISAAGEATMPEFWGTPDESFGRDIDTSTPASPEPSPVR